MYNWLKRNLEISHGNNTVLNSMEGLRGVAVFLVFLVHYSSLIEPWIQGGSIYILKFVHSMGHLGVDLFFVLSGYLIYGSIVGKLIFSPFKYGFRRFQRIYPTFLVVFLIYIVLSFAFPSESKLPKDMYDAIIYILQNLIFLPGIFDIKPVIVVAWSLSYEVFYYIFIPVVVVVLRMKSWPSSSRILFWTLSSVIGFLCFSIWGGPVRLMMFIAGIILYELHSNKIMPLHRWGGIALVAALIVFGLRAFFSYSYILSLSAVFVLFLVLCLSAFNPKSSIYKLLVFTPVRLLGNMSYSYYLIHGLTLKFCFLIFLMLVPKGFESDILYFWFWIPLFFLTLVSSFILFFFVERPLSLNEGGKKVT